jgi:hypothetical protein
MRRPTLNPMSVRVVVAVLTLLCIEAGANAVAEPKERGPLQVGHDEEIERIRQAVAALRYPEAQSFCVTAIKAGGHRRPQLVQLYALCAEVTSVLDGPEAGERDFRRLLVLAPDHQPPRRDSPVLMAPFTNARRWVAENGPLRVETLPEESTDLGVRIGADPLAMVAGVQLFVRRRSGAFERVPGQATHVPAAGLEGPDGVEYYMQLVDQATNTLAELGSPQAPLHRRAVVAADAMGSARGRTAAPARRDRRWVWGVVGAAIAVGAGVGIAVWLTWPRAATAPPVSTTDGTFRPF